MVRQGLFFFLFLIYFLPTLGQTRASLPLIENKGQWNTDYDFGTWFPGGNMLISGTGFNITLYDAVAIEAKHLASHGEISEADGSILCDDFLKGHNLQLQLVNSKQTRKFQTRKLQSTYYNFFMGEDTSRWQGNAKAFYEIIYEEVYEGVDMAISSVGHNLKYDFIVSPCADPGRIALAYSGSELIGLENNDIVVQTSLGRVIEKKPVAYQMISGKKVNVPVNYRLENQRILFEFSEGYDESMELVIDPLLVFSTYSGSAADNWGSSATPGEGGSLYSSGVTNHFVGENFSGTFPATPGAFQVSYGGIYDVAILKYDSLGRNLLYASYLGGAANDSPHSLVIDKDENLLVLGTTSSANFPTTDGVISQSFNGGATMNTDVLDYINGSDIFISKISRNGSSLVKSTYLGGSGNDGLNSTLGPLTKNYGDENRGDIITDSNGNIYISSLTWSSSFPAVNSFSTSFKGGETDAIIAKIDPDLSTIIWSAFLGGSGYDASHTIKFNEAEDIIVAGGTTSTDFPITPGAYQTSFQGVADGWVAILSGDGQSILNATYTGSNLFDQVYIIDANSFDEIYTYGQTTGPMPVTPGKYNNPNSGQFVQKFTPDLSALEWSTVFGTGVPVPNISPTAFLVNDCENIYLAGWGGLVNSTRYGWPSNTFGLPISFDAVQSTTQGSDFYFMVLSEEANRFSYGTYLGGTQSAVHVDGGTSRFDKRGIVYHAVCSGCFAASSDFPTTPGAYSATNNSINCNNAAFKFDLSLLKAQFRTNSLDFSAPNSGSFCFPEPVVFENLSVGGEIFEWRFGDGTLELKLDTTVVTHSYSVPGTYIVQLTSIDQNTCIGIDSVSRTINIYDRNSKVQGDDEVCFNTEYTLKATGGISYTWQDSEGNVISNEAEPVVRLTETSDYYVTVVESTGCDYMDTVHMEVIDPIIPDFDLIINGNCFDRPQIEVIDKSIFSPGDTLYFDFGDGYISTLSETSHSFAEDGFYTVRKVGKGKICSYEKVIQVPIFTLKVPNVITPGLEDGKNDYLVVQFGDGSETANSIGYQAHLTILNRWGKVVFESLDYQNDWKADNVPAGVYYYQVEVPNYSTCSGWVDVLK